jgi:hypothetical protein
MVVKDKVSDDKGHSNHDHGPPDEAQPEALPEWNDEERRQDVVLHVIGQVPGHTHALKQMSAVENKIMKKVFANTPTNNFSCFVFAHVSTMMSMVSIQNWVLFRCFCMQHSTRKNICLVFTYH